MKTLPRLPVSQAGSGAQDPVHRLSRRTPTAEWLTPEYSKYAPFHGHDEAYLDKHEPQAGGYYVRYADGYESWSPAEAFENGYMPINPRVVSPSPSIREPDEDYELVPLRISGNGADIVRLNETEGATPVDDVQSHEMHLLKTIAAGFINQIDHDGNDPRTTALARTKMQEACFYAMNSVTAPAHS